jgi:hypothetical protein
MPVLIALASKVRREGLPAVLDLIDLIPLCPPVQILAEAARPATVRSLDAIYLGTALQCCFERVTRTRTSVKSRLSSRSSHSSAE